jgi:putative transposase
LNPSHTSTLEVLRGPLDSAQYLSIRYSARLAANDIVASVGSKGDSYDCEMVVGSAGRV